METQICTKCGIEKELDEYYFRKDTQKYHGTCKKCHASRNKRYREGDNREKILRKKKEYHRKNRERENKRRRDSYHSDLDKNRAKHREYSKVYRMKHPDRRRKTSKKYYEKNKDKINVNNDSKRKARKAWAERNPDVSHNRNYLRRLRIKTNGAYEFINRAKVFDRDKGVCYLCGGMVDPKDWHLDHIISLKNGGTNTYNNVAVTHPKCNLKKGRNSAVR